MLLLSLAKFPDHGLDFAGDRLERHVGGRRFIDEVRVHQRLVAFRQRTDRRDQVTVGERAIGAGAFCQGETESEDQFFALVEKLLGNLNFGKQSLAILLARPPVLRRRALTRLLSCLQKIRTVARAVERHLALLAATLRTDFSVYGRAKPLLFSFFTDRAMQR